MSQLLDAIAGVANASEPVPGLVTGGQPQPAHLAALKAAGCRLVLDARDPMEPRPFRVPDAVTAAGLEYVNIPVGHTRGDDATLERIRRVIADAVAAGRPVFFHCASGNRTGAAIIPYLVLDRGQSEEDAVNTAMKCGLRSAELMEWAVEYVGKCKS